MEMLIGSGDGWGDESRRWMIVSSVKMALCVQLVETRCHLAPTYLMAMRCVVCEVQSEEWLHEIETGGPVRPWRPHMIDVNEYGQTAG